MPEARRVDRGAPGTWAIAARTQLRRYVRTLRKTLEPFDGWPRDPRAWARRDRIDVLLSGMEAERFGAMCSDPTRFLRLVEELREWLAREQEFIRTYPFQAVPEHWTRREQSPAARRRVERESRALVKAVSQRAPEEDKKPRKPNR